MVFIDLNQWLENIILKNEIWTCYPDYMKKIQANLILKKFFSDLKEPESIFLLSVAHNNLDISRANITSSDDIEEVLDILSKEEKRYIKKSLEISNKDIRSLTLDQLKVEDCKTILLVSYEKHNELFYAVNSLLPEMQIIDIYDLFLEAGIFFEKEFYLLGTRIHDDYGNIFYCKKKYMLSQNRKVKKIYLEKLIFHFLDIRDFVSTIFYTDIYIAEGFDSDGKYAVFLIELNQMLENIKHKLQSRKQEDIIFNWVDAIQYEELNKMEFLKTEAEKGVFFENAYTVAPWTIPTFYTIFNKLKMVDDEYFRLRESGNKLKEENSILLKLLQEKGFDFKEFGVNVKIFDEKKRDKEYNLKNDLCPIIQWNMICKLINAQEKCFFLIHNALETHTPYIAGNITENYRYETLSPNGEQIDEARAYADGQLEFYSKLLPVTTKRIYMSDHGKLHKDLFHTFLFFAGKGFEARRYPEVFSYIYFYELIQYVIEPEKYDIEELFSEFAELQDTDKYASKWVPIFTQGGHCIDEMLGYRGARSKKDIYIRRNDGVESYYLIRDDKKNLIWDEKYQDRIALLRKAAGTYTIDVFKDDFFKNCRRYYIAIDHYKKRIAAMQDIAKPLLLELAESIPKGSIVAIRGGGEHTQELLRVIGSCLTIRFIIDKNLEECNRIPQYKYITVEEMKSYKIDIVVISSYRHRRVMAEEVRKVSNYYMVIDIYEFFESKGLFYKQPFYGGEILLKEDFEN